MYENEREALIQAFKALGYNSEGNVRSPMFRKRFRDNNTIIFLYDYEIKLEFTQAHPVPQRKLYTNTPLGWKTIYWGTYDDLIIDKEFISIRVGEFKFIKFKRDLYFIHVDVARGMQGKKWRICHEEQKT